MLTLEDLLARTNLHSPHRACPFCEKRWSISTVIATRHCPNCGRHVVSGPQKPHVPVIREDFITGLILEQIRTNHRITIVVLIASVVFLVNAVGIALYRDTLLEFLRLYFDHDTARDVGFMGVFVPVFVALCFVGWIETKREAESGQCPCCRATLANQLTLLALTGNCNTCGQTIVTLCPPSQVNDPPHTIESLRASRQMIETRPLRVFGATVVLSLSMVVVSSHVFKNYQPPIWSRLTIIEQACIVIGGFILQGLPAMYGFFIIARRAAYPPQEQCCPFCRKPLTQLGIVIATRRCPHCQNQIVRAETSEPDGESGQ
jgi:endogenous inhibitor of DNA gyrase (YacG/DUF329 family)